MTPSQFCISDVLFRRTRDDECSIVVFGFNVGTLIRLRDLGDPDQPVYYVISLFRDTHGPRQVDHRSQIRLATADMLWERRLVPPTNQPPHPAPQLLEAPAAA